MRRAATIVTRLALLLLVATLLLTALTLGYARARGLTVLSVRTGSMRPAIRPGDAVLVRMSAGGSASTYSFRPGDIISYRQADNPKIIITHRLVAVDRRSSRLITQGDSLATADSPFASSQVVGVVQRIIPVAGYSFDFVRRPYGLVILVYLPAVILTAGEIRRLMNYYASLRYRLYGY